MSRLRRALCAVAALAAAAFGPPASAQGRADGIVADLPTRPGVTMRYLAVEPDRRPGAVAILFVGGLGAPALPSRGDADWVGGGNFLARSRELFRQRGIVAIVVGAPSDHRDGLRAWRLTDEHANDIAALIGEARRRWRGLPVWLVGTSTGTVSAASVAARLGPGTVDGVILTATVTRGGRADNDLGGRSVNDVSLADLRMPVLLVHHRDDRCVASPFAGAEALRGRLSGAARSDLIAVSGGDPPRSGPCDPYSPHGFLGVEAQAVDAMAAWMGVR